jgi:hypothetical protein
MLRQRSIQARRNVSRLLFLAAELEQLSPLLCGNPLRALSKSTWSIKLNYLCHS